MNGERLIKIAGFTALAVGAFELSNSAFTKKVKKEIHERDGYKCVVCGATDCLNAAHIDHNKDNAKRYNDPSNGRTLCEEDHLRDHLNRAGKNGLTDKENQFAIEMLLTKISRRDHVEHED